MPPASLYMCLCICPFFIQDQAAGRGCTPITWAKMRTDTRLLPGRRDTGLRLVASGNRKQYFTLGNTEHATPMWPSIPATGCHLSQRNEGHVHAETCPEVYNSCLTGSQTGSAQMSLSGELMNTVDTTQWKEKLTHVRQPEDCADGKASPQRGVLFHSHHVLRTPNITEGSAEKQGRQWSWEWKRIWSMKGNICWWGWKGSAAWLCHR